MIKDKYKVQFSDDMKTLLHCPETIHGEYIIPDTVTNIKDWAFCGCSGLTSVTISNSVTSIGDSAFTGCTSLTSITIPDSVISIRRGAFFGCTSLTNITIPNSVTSIGDYVFSGCTCLTSIKVEQGNTKYDSRDNCNAINETATNTLIGGCQNTVIPESVTSIGYAAFRGCSGLTNIKIPNSVTSIGDWAFSCCKGLTSVIIPNSVTSIGHHAFEGCTGLASVTIPDSVENIGISVFNGCESLTSITIPERVTSIGASPFFGCTSLTSVTIHDTPYETHKIKNGKAIAYKGFYPDMTCRDFQYEEGKTFVFDGEPELCKQGFHACLNIKDVFNYYANKIGQNFVVHEVILEGITDERGDDSKVVGKRITIGKKIL